jgi:hypothetical protein
MATCASGTLVGTLQWNRMIQQFCLLETGRRVAVLTLGSVVGIAWWLVAVAALASLGQIQSPVTVQTWRFGMFSDEFQRMGLGTYLGPFLCGLVTLVAIDGWHGVMGGNMAGVTVGEFTV